LYEYFLPSEKLDVVARSAATSRGKLIIECDEMWSFVSSKKNKFYIWLGIDRDTREIIGCLSVIELVVLPVNFGLIYLMFIVNVLLLIPTFGKLIVMLFLVPANQVRN